jgi:hypothetical protein
VVGTRHNEIRLSIILAKSIEDSSDVGAIDTPSNVIGLTALHS